ncbi:MAG: hypothetical protein AAFQ66_19505 [Pseudomonadota bacterium]
MSDVADVKTPRKLGWLVRPLEFVLKWGLLGLTILLLIVLAGKFGYQIQITKLFGQDISITKVTERVETNDEMLANLEERVTHLTESLARLTQDLSEGNAVRSVSPSSIREFPSEQGVVTQPVLASQPIDGEGVIWLGQWSAEANGWLDGSVAALASLPKPVDLVGKDLELATSVNVRADFPAPPSRGYYSVVPSKGVATGQTKVTVLEQPRAYRFENGTQYWAKVETQFEPKAAAVTQ